MDETSMERLDEFIVAAGEFIRAKAPCVVSIYEILDGLTDSFADRFQVSDEVYEVLNLIATLWAEPHIRDPQAGWFEFIWSEERTDQARDTTSPLRALLLERSHSELATTGQSEASQTSSPDDASEES
ncbi:MAG TPA: hypothetical protein PLI79_02980 [Mycobacterium sp.]|nr:hypothetical protein [Mycobacterium sp.]